MHSIPGSSIILRKFENSDIDALWEFRNNVGIVRLLGGFSTGYSRADIGDWIEFHRMRSDEVLYAIVDSEVDLCLGHVGLYNIDHRTRKAEFAILIGNQDYQGRGIGKSVSSFMLEYGFQQLNLNKITLSVIEQNTPAHSLYSKLGFLAEGVARQDLWRDGRYWNVVHMSILQSEWARTLEDPA